MNYEVIIGPGPTRVRHLDVARFVHMDAFLAHGNDCRVCRPDAGRGRDCIDGARLRAAALEELAWLGPPEVAA